MRTGASRIPVLFAALHLLLAHSAWARVYDLYRVNYQKNAFCAAIGGACTSDTNRENSLFQNPAAIVTGEPGILFDGDLNFAGNLEPGMRAHDDIRELTYMAGIGWSWKDFGVGATLMGSYAVVKSHALFHQAAGIEAQVDATAESKLMFFSVPIGWRVSEKLALGASVLGRYYSEAVTPLNSPESETQTRNTVPPPSLGAGAIYFANEYLRLGTWFRLPVRYDVARKIIVNAPSGQIAVDETISVRFPALYSVGASWMPWADDATLFADLVLVGRTTNSYLRTLDTFPSNLGSLDLPAKGRDLVLEPHLGWRSPLSVGLPFTLHLGSYYESSRIQGISGRVHGTTSLSYKLSAGFEPLLGIDLARDYVQVLVTVR